jgi:acetylornithine deacetylase/succinyl-diaminopimelate desuccinylase-like protein
LPAHESASYYCLMTLRSVLAAVLAAASAGWAWDAPESPPQAAHRWRIGHEQQILQEFGALLAIPDVASDTANIRRNADALVQALQRRHVAAKLLTIPGANPVVYGDITTPGAKHTIVFYAHYDGQPVTPDEWEGKAPFTPVTRTVNGEPRIFARAAADDKAAIMAQLTAIDALQAAHIPLRANVRFVWEGEEEAGSTHLRDIIERYRSELGGDVWLICDGPVDQSGRQTVVFGARGVTHMQVTVFGPNRELHSGHYGNWAPNPAMMLAQLIAGMKDETGHVLVPHFYDGVAPLGDLERRAIAEAPANESTLRQEFALGHADGDGKRLLELLNEPALNIDGMSSARTGATANNVIPSTATADIDLRLVKGADWKAEQEHVVNYIASRGYFVTDTTPDRAMLLAHPKVALVVRGRLGYNAVRTPMDLPIGQAVIAAVESARGPVVRLPTMGGSVPLEMIEEAAGARPIIVPIANYDDNQHAANENLRLQNLWDGIETMAALEAMP